MGALAIIGAVIFAAWFRSWLAVLLAVLVIALLLVSFLRSRRIDEAEMIRRQDEAMGKLKDDPNEMARWVP
jgi:hypothetical protein